jgi:hypothetical protein
VLRLLRTPAKQARPADVDAILTAVKNERDRLDRMTSVLSRARKAGRRLIHVASTPDDSASLAAVGRHDSADGADAAADDISD